MTAASASAALERADPSAFRFYVDWTFLGEIPRVLDMPAGPATDAFVRALELLTKGTGAVQAVLALSAPGETALRVCAAYPPRNTEPASAGLGAALLAAASGGQSVRHAGGRSSEGTLSLAVPLLFDGHAAGALGMEVPHALAPHGEAIENAMAVAAALFKPVLRAQVAALQTAADSALPGISKALRAVGLVGSSEAMQTVYTRLTQVAPTSTTVLLRGASGTGKELVARALHAASPRAGGPFISLSCAALPESLIESELFGHEKGAFTGATAMRKGRFELAHGGTLFLDEVGELPMLTQVKLLRVLQERSFERLGSMQSRQVDIRVITATNSPLEAMVEEGSFRRDLYYRLNVFSIHLPLLCERKSDILLLANHFLAQFAAQHKRTPPHIALSAADMLHRYAWPGNIRELENLMERALLLMDGGELLLPQHLPPEMHSATCPFCSTSLTGHVRHDVLLGGTLPERLEELERGSIVDALASHQGHMGRAAAFLGLTERVLAFRMRKYGLSYKAFRKA